MPTKKRKRNGATATIPSSTLTATAGKFQFLGLPLEVRLKIYEYCYLPQPVTLQENSRRQSPKPVISKPRERAFFAKTKCKHPFLHQSLLLTCRQTHADVLPFYVPCHSFGFSHIFKFANDFLSFQPPHQLSLIRHLSLRVGEGWSTHDPTSISGVKKLIADFNMLFDHYPDVFDNLLSFTWEVTDKRYFNSNRGFVERSMHSTLLQRLVTIHRQERTQMGLTEWEPLCDHPARDSLRKWRTGVTNRTQRLFIEEIEMAHETSSLVFFEQLPMDFENNGSGWVFWRYIDVKDWMSQKFPEPPTIERQPWNSTVTYNGAYDPLLITIERQGEWPLTRDLVHISILNGMEDVLVMDVGTASHLHNWRHDGSH